MMEKTARQAELKKSASSFFDPILYLKINNLGIPLKELVKFKTFPMIIADKRITVGRLSELTGAEGGIADLVIYNVGMGIDLLANQGLARQNGDFVTATAKGTRLFRFFEDENEVTDWLRGEARKAIFEKVNMARFAQNVNKVYAIIDAMTSSYREELKSARRDRY